MTPEATERLLQDVRAYVDERLAPEGGVRFSARPSASCGDGAFLADAPAPPCSAAPPDGEGISAEEAGCARRGIPKIVGSIKARFSHTESIDELLARREATFSEALLREIDARGLTDPEVYRRANIDRRLFSKIRGDARYRPKKSTAVALALALNMSLDETLDLIGRAGYTLTASSEADLIVSYFIERECWDVNLINQVLYRFDQPLIGC